MSGVIFSGPFVTPKGQINPVISMTMERGHYMAENKDFCECPYCEAVIETGPGCYKVKCKTCGAIITGCHK